MTFVPLSGQRRVDPRHAYERIFIACPLTGSGTYADPKRPLFVPAPSQMNPANRSGVIAWHFDLSDDGRTALVEVVLANKSAVSSAFASLAALPATSTFLKGRDSRVAVETAFKALKKNFDLDRFMMRVHQ